MNASARLGWFVVVATFATACGGIAIGPVPDSDTDAGNSDGGTSDASTQDSGPGPHPTPKSPLCPDVAPTAGTSCSVEQTECEYGNAWWNIACDVVMQCTGGQWQTTQPSFENCTTQPGPNDATCPSTLASIPQGATCSNNGLSCYYPDGFCTCANSFGGPESNTVYWNCLPENGCPYPRPPLGSECSGTSSCTYEECSYAQVCVNGAWQGSPEACASAGE